jgi:hypothetical protein
MRDPVSEGVNLGAPPTERTRGPRPAAAAGLGTSPLVTHICIDAGVSHLRLIGVGEHGERLVDTTLPSDERLRGELLAWVEGRVAAGVTVVMATHYRAEWPRNASHELHLSHGAVARAGKLRA